MAGNETSQAATRPAEIVREYGFPGVEKIAGVTHDGRRVWAATGAKLMAFDPEYVSRVLRENFEDAKALFLSPLVAIHYAHLVMLTGQGIVSADAARLIRTGLDRIDEDQVRTVTYDGQVFAIAPQYTFGNAGRNSLTGPSYASLDLSVSKRLALFCVNQERDISGVERRRELLTLDFRISAISVHSNFCAPIHGGLHSLDPR